MFKIFILLSLFALAFAKPGYLHSTPIHTSYQHHAVAVPAVHIVRPVIASHGIVSTSSIHHRPALVHGSYHGGYHGGYHGSIHHGLF